MSHDQPIKLGPKLKRALNIFYVICALLFLVDLIYHRHTVWAFEEWWGFYAIYGFVSCVVLVLLAKQMRHFLMRDERYYQDMEDKND